MNAPGRPFSAVVVPFPWPGVCTHPLIRCLPELDEQKHRVLACACGATRAVSATFEHAFWFRARTNMLARAIQEDRLAEIDQLAEGL